MATPEELLRKLDERFILGEITEESYNQMRARLQAQAAAIQTAAAQAVPSHPAGADGGAAGDPSAGGMSISDSVIKGNVTSGSASVGSINIHVGQKDSDEDENPELDYERCVLMVLRSGGHLDAARRELDDCRQKLGLSLRLARDIEEACVKACWRPEMARPPQGLQGPPGPQQPDPITQLFKSLKDTFAPAYVPPPAGGTPLAGVPAGGMPPSAPARTRPPPMPPAVAGRPGAKPPPLEAAARRAAPPPLPAGGTPRPKPPELPKREKPEDDQAMGATPGGEAPSPS
jgi:hypothetical protein